MLKSHFKIGWRNLSRQKMYSAVKIGGFSIGIAACLLIALFIRNELSYDRHYKNGERVYRVIRTNTLDGEMYKSVYFPAPLASALLEDYPEIEQVARFNPTVAFGAGSNEVRRSDKLENFHEQGFIYADPQLLELLEIPMVYGNRALALKEPNTIVITRRKADKFFPGEDPVGKILILNNDETRPYKVGGVIEDFPPTSHLQYDFLITLTAREFWQGEQTNWQSSNYHTYVLLHYGTDVTQLEQKLPSLIKMYLPSALEMKEVWATRAVERLKTLSFELQPVSDIYLNSDIEDHLSHGDIRYIWLFGAIASFILIIACINFINLSTAKSANRAKEVGLRKVVGSFRSSLIKQFLTESLLFSFFSFVLALFLAWVFLPYFNILLDRALVFPWKEWWLFPVIVSGVIIIGIAAGVYPSFYLSSFKPIDVLKGKVSLGSKNSLTRSLLVVFQFTISIILLTGTFIIYKQMQYLLNKKLGFVKDQVLLIQATDMLGNQVPTFKNELLDLPQVKYVTICDYLPVAGTHRNGNGFWNDGQPKTDKAVGAQIWRVDVDYIKTLGMKLLEGRNFSTELASDSQAMIINQSMARALGLKHPVGKGVENYEKYNVIGVVEDFHFESMKANIEPLCLVLGNSPKVVSVKANTANMRELIDAVSNVWKRFSPHQPIRFTFLDQSYAQMYKDVERMARIFTSFTVLAIIVACLGLFALSAFMVEQRGKEISIRLVLGASVKNIFNLLTMNFVKLVVIAFVIALPVTILMMREWLNEFAYKIEITWDIFALAGLLALVIAIFTISYQSIRAALMNPVKSLKTE